MRGRAANRGAICSIDVQTSLVTGNISVRVAAFSQILSTRLVLSGPSVKNISFFFSETVLLCRHPASLRGALRAIVTTRGAGMRWTFGWRETNAKLADVKSCGPDTPTLVSALMRKHHALRWPKSPVHRGEHDISVTPSRGECRLFRLNLW